MTNFPTSNPMGFGNGTWSLPSYNKAPRKSIVQVYFPHRKMSWPYFNDKFDLKVGDTVYVDGKLQGYKGQVTEVSYSFKIKLSDYKRVLAVVDTNVSGDFYIADTCVVTFDRNAIPFEKVLPWFKAPENDDEEYVIGDGDGETFNLEEVEKWDISSDTRFEGEEYYEEDAVLYLSLDGNKGKALVEGSEIYEVEFDYSYGKISNLICSCWCCSTCKHSYAAMLQLKSLLGVISEKYQSRYGNYFAAISKDVFSDMIVKENNSGKISVEV